MILNTYFTLGNSGLRVSRLALGTMTFGTDWGWGADKNTARAMFNAYADSGGNLVDTADLYTNGVSEQWVGEFIKERTLREQMVITTKFSFNAAPDNPNAGGNGRKNILRAVEGSLRRLDTDYIDLYLLHAWDMLTPVEEVMRSFDDLVRAGKVRYVGLSNIPAWYASRAQTIAELRGYEPLSALQLEYSLATRTIEHEYIPLATQYGMGVMVWSPLASGLLSGKYQSSQTGEFGAGRLQTLNGSNNPSFQKLTERNFKIVAELEQVAREIDRSMAQVAINWVAGRSGVATVLVGATKITQLEENLHSLDFELPATLRNRLDEASILPTEFPYTFFTPPMQAMQTGANTVGDKPDGYTVHRLFQAEAAGIQGEE